MSRQPAGRPIRISPQGLTWRGNTGESSHEGGLGLPPATTATTPQEGGHPRQTSQQKGPNKWRGFTDTQDTNSRGIPQMHQNSTLKGKQRGRHTWYPEEEGADIFAQGTAYDSPEKGCRHEKPFKLQRTQVRKIQGPTLGRDDLGVVTKIRFLHTFYELRNRMESSELYGKPLGWLLYPPRKVHLWQTKAFNRFFGATSILVVLLMLLFLVSSSVTKTRWSVYLGF